VSLEVRIEELEQELRALRDRERICNLMADYFAAVDVGWEAELPDKRERLIESVFAADVVVEMITGSGPSVFRGRTALREAYDRDFDAYPFGIHYGSNPRLTIDGDQADGAWHVFAPCTDPEGVSRWFGGRYLVEFARAPEGWRISRLVQQVAFFTAFDRPWSGRAG